jgi:CRISPR system Cascade subunit CasD
MIYLVFRLSGDFASWGDIALGELRPSASHPSRSALLGILGACLGIQKEDWDRKEALAKSLAFAIRVDEVQDRIYDYQTTQVCVGVNTESAFDTRVKGVKNIHSMPLSIHNKVPPGKTAEALLSQREYCVCAHYTIAVLVKDENVSLDEIVQAQSFPMWNPVLGRFCCLCSSHLDPQVIEADTVMQAFSKAVFPPFPKVPTKKHKSLYWEQGIDLHMGVQAECVVKRRDDPDRNYFLVRDEYHAQVQG